MLRLDFYESGVGETIVITFPDGGVGLVDAHPSQRGTRPSIQNIIAGKNLHFVCLTHPHEDHGLDLIPVLETHPAVNSFWHSASDICRMLFESQDVKSFPGPHREVALTMRKGWAEFLCDLFGAVVQGPVRDIKQFHSGIADIDIAGVLVSCIGPSEKINERFIYTYKERLQGKDAKLPDPNLSSIILTLKYGNTVVILGGDALKENWKHAVDKYNRKGWPKAHLLKVPHHGASNAIILHPHAGETNYLEICSRDPKSYAVLFAGDSKHPDGTVYTKLREKTMLSCLSNGYRKRNRFGSNPLGIDIPGARIVAPAEVCNDILSFELDAAGGVRCVSGHDCDHC